MNFREMTAQQMAEHMRGMAEIAPNPELQECYQRAAALLAPAQGARTPDAWQHRYKTDGLWSSWHDGRANSVHKFRPDEIQERPLYASPDAFLGICQHPEGSR